MIPREGVVQTQIVMTVEGTEKAAAQLKSVSDAEKGVGEAAKGATKDVAFFEAGAKGATSGLGDLDRAHRQTKASLSDLKAGYGDAAKQMRDVADATAKSTGGMGGFGKAIDSVLGPLRTAANIIPGFGISGLILGIGTAVVSLVDALRSAGDPTGAQVDRLRMLAAASDAAAQASGRLAVAQTAAAQSAYLAAGGSGPIGGRAIARATEQKAIEDQIRTLGEQRVALAQNPAAEFLSQDGQAQYDALQEKAARAHLAASALGKSWGGTGLGHMSEAERSKALASLGSLNDQADDFERQAAFVYEKTKLTTDAIDDLVGYAQNRLSELDGPPKPSSGGAHGAHAPSVVKGPKAWWDLERGPARSSNAGEGRTRSPTAADMEEFGKPALADARLATQDITGNSEALKRNKEIHDLNAATERLHAKQTGMLEGLGQGMANAAAATIIAGKGFKAAAHEMLEALAIQAGGQALWEAAMAIASLAMFNYPAAAMHGEAAGMFAAIAVGGALGAAGTRGGGGGRAHSSASTSTPSLMNPYAGNNGGDTHVTVILGTEVVTRGVKTQTRKEERRGGISEGRMARAA